MAAPKYSYSHNYRASKKARQIKKVKSAVFSWASLWITVSILCFLSLLYFLFFSQYLQIKNIEISGTIKLNQDEFKNFVNNNINKNFLFIKSRSYFLVSKKNTEKLSLLNYPLIEDIKVSKNFPNSIKITIKERQPIFSLCGSNGCFDIDRGGISFLERAAQNLESARFECPKEIKLGSQAIGEDLFAILKNIEDKLKDFGDINASQVLFSDNLSKITVNTEAGWQIFLSKEASISTQFANLSLALDQKIPPEKRQDLEYIDLQFTDKIFYKYKSVDAVNKN